MVTINSITALALALLCSWAVMSPRVRDGIVIKFGLIVMALGYIVTFVQLVDGMDCDDMRGLARAALMTRAGLLIVVAGWCWRSDACRHRLTRMTDWISRTTGRERQP